MTRLRTAAGEATLDDADEPGRYRSASGPTSAADA